LKTLSSGIELGFHTIESGFPTIKVPESW
jgi:hypothetical protein